MNNILIATDGTEAADEALDVAIDMALEAHAALNVLSVRRPRPAGRCGAGPAILEVEMRDGPKRIAEAWLRRRTSATETSPTPSPMPQRHSAPTTSSSAPGVSARCPPRCAGACPMPSFADRPCH